MENAIAVLVYMDGNQWCALLGDDIMSGTAGFGNTPAEALRDLADNWPE